jgi:hypothetical protein
MIKMNERIKCVCYNEFYECFVAGGVHGGFFKLTKDLKQIDSLDDRLFNLPISNIISYKEYLFARDIMGGIYKLCCDKLKIISFINTGEATKNLDEELEESLLVNSHGIHIYNNSLYVVSGTGNLIKVDPELFVITDLFDPIGSAYVDTINTSSTSHFLSDFSGHIWKGSLDTKKFEKFMKYDSGPIHCIAYDSKYNRYWSTSDNSFKVNIFTENETISESIELTNDDIEWIDFNSDASEAYVACFDHYLYIFKNDLKPNLKEKIGPFKFQLNFVQCVDDKIYVILESGEFYCIEKNKEIIQTNFKGNCIWHMVFKDDNSFYCALEDGSIRSFKIINSDYSIPSIELISENFLDHGRVRRVAITDNYYFGITTESYVFCYLKENDQFQWKTKLNGICRDICISNNNELIYVATESNSLFEIDAKSGEIVLNKTYSAPIWSLCYHPNNYLIVAERRNNIYIYNDIRNEPLSKFNYIGNVKGIRVLQNKNILINGTSFIKEVEIDSKNNLILKKIWDEGLYSTCEYALKDEENERIYAVSYTQKLSNFTYHANELVHKENFLLDFPKSILIYEHNQVKYLIVSGRGCYISFFRIHKDYELVKVSEYFI